MQASASLFFYLQAISPLYQDSPTFLHPNVVLVLIGCNVLDMFYQLDLSLLEVLFVYMVKMS